MIVLWYALFLLLSHLLLMRVFSITTYHRFFWPALPLLLGYSALVGWLLYRFGLHAFFAWHVVLASAWLFSIGRKNAALGDALLIANDDDAGSVRFMAKSGAQTLRYYTYSSIIYIVVFSVTFLAAFNGAQAAEFHGYDCKADCSGHEAGYAWAAKHMYDDPAQCRGKSQSFVEGCRAWVDEQAKADPDCEDDPEICIEGGVCEDEDGDGECDQ